MERTQEQLQWLKESGDEYDAEKERIKRNLAMTPEERYRRHQRLVRELLKLKLGRRARS